MAQVILKSVTKKFGKTEVRYDGDGEVGYKKLNEMVCPWLR